MSVVTNMFGFQLKVIENNCEFSFQYFNLNEDARTENKALSKKRCDAIKGCILFILLL